MLDPFSCRPGTFHLELVTGRIYPNPKLSAGRRQAASKTIDRLGLDEYECREMRALYYRDYRDGHLSEAYFRRRSPFVWSEAKRQGLL